MMAAVQDGGRFVFARRPGVMDVERSAVFDTIQTPRQHGQPGGGKVGKRVGGWRGQREREKKNK